MINNPYLTEFNKIKDNWNQWEVRNSLVRQYSWAIPFDFARQLQSAILGKSVI